jgi:hypothetical protein
MRGYRPERSFAVRPFRRVAPWLALPFLALFAVWSAAPADIGQALAGFRNPPDDARIMMRWWWFGPAVEKPELRRELEAMRQGGIGGVEIQPVYPVTVDGNFQYLSPEFLDDVRFTNETARGLGMRVDITLGSGWPYGGPRTTIDLAAPRLRVERVPVPANAASVSVPALREGERLVAAFLSRGAANERLTGLDGAVAHVPPEAASGRVVLFFISSRTRMAVKRAAVGAEGFVLDHYSRAAIEEHLKSVGAPLLQAFGKNQPYAVFSDSLEVAGSDWSTDFLAEFQRRRGYDLTPYLPALAGDIGENTAAVRQDWGETLTELVNENYLTPIREWARAHGALFRSQTYGSPPVNLSSNALVDLPEGEGSQWHSFSTTRWATSANHLYGRPISSSETWTWLHSPVFRATPLDMKAEADLHFLQGVNQLVGHGWPYSPPEAGEPGWHFYAAAVFSEHNPWWLVMPDVTRYLQRVSYLLRQGEPVTDVALYLPTADAYARFTLGHASVTDQMSALLGPQVVGQVLDAGYNFDFIDDAAIGKLGIPYPILILPGIERIPLATYRKIEDYARKGGVVIATRRTPSLAPGLADAADTPAIRELSRTLFAGTAKLVADESRLGGALHTALAPDVSRPPEVGFVHRKLEGGDIYFLANTSNHEVRGSATFRGKSSNGEWWDPFGGKDPLKSGYSFVLAPYESCVIAFHPSALLSTRFPTAGRAILDLSSGWKLTFPGADPIALDRLISWTDLDPWKYFSGQATYEKTVTLDGSLWTWRQSMFLNFGEGTPVTVPQRRSGSGMRAMLESPVREAAIVEVNGKPAGSVWHPPYELDVTGLLHPGENTIRVVVANLAINELAHQPPADHRALIQKYGDRFQDQDMTNLQPLPSGLLGPVRLIAR